MKKVVIAAVMLMMVGIFWVPVAQGCDMEKLDKLVAYAFKAGKLLDLGGKPAVVLEKKEPVAEGKEKAMYLAFLFAETHDGIVVYQIHAIEEAWEQSADGAQVTIRQKMGADVIKENGPIDGRLDFTLSALLIKDKDGKVLKHEIAPMKEDEAEIWYDEFVNKMHETIPTISIPVTPI